MDGHRARRVCRRGGAFVGEGGRHTDVDERKLRVVHLDGVDEGLGVADHGTGVDAGLAEQA